MIINKIHSLTINQQIWFFSNFCNQLRKTYWYAWIIEKKNESYLMLYRFLWKNHWYQSFLNLLKHKKTKIWKSIINRFVIKVFKDEKLFDMTSTLLDLDKELFISASMEPDTNKNDFSKIEEKERINSRIESGFLWLSAEGQRNFLLKIYKKITNEDIVITSSKEMTNIKEVINNFIKSKSEYIFSLFFFKDNKIKSKKYIEKLVLWLCKSIECKNYCVQFFWLEEEIRNIEEENTDTKVSPVANFEALDWIQKDTWPKDIWAILTLVSDKDDILDWDEIPDWDEPWIILDWAKSEKLSLVKQTLNSEENIWLRNYLNWLNAIEQREFLIKLFNEAKKIDNLQVIMWKWKTLSLQLTKLFKNGLDLSEKNRKRLNMNLYFLLDNWNNSKLQEETIDFIIRFLLKNEVLFDTIWIVVETRKNNKTEIVELEVLSNESVIEWQMNKWEIVDTNIQEREDNSWNKILPEIPKINKETSIESQEWQVCSEKWKIIEPPKQKVDLDVSIKWEQTEIKPIELDVDKGWFLKERPPAFDKMGETIKPIPWQRREVLSTYSSMASKIKPSTSLKLSDFLVVINAKIQEKLRENHPKIKSENYKDYEILDWHFITVLSWTDWCIIQNMFSNLQEWIKKCDRWQNITEIISLVDLDNELSRYIMENRINKTESK